MAKTNNTRASSFTHINTQSPVKFFTVNSEEILMLEEPMDSYTKPLVLFSLLLFINIKKKERNSKIQ